MELLKELIKINEAQDSKSSRVTSQMAGAVYHRDYKKTKHKKYRKYDKAARRSK